jgi:hypothetical protein
LEENVTSTYSYGTCPTESQTSSRFGNARNHQVLLAARSGPSQFDFTDALLLRRFTIDIRARKVCTMKIARSFLFILPFVWTCSYRLEGGGDPPGRQPSCAVWASASDVRESSSTTAESQSAAADEEPPGLPLVGSSGEVTNLDLEDQLGGSADAETAGTSEATQAENSGGPAKLAAESQSAATDEEPSGLPLVGTSGAVTNMDLEDELGGSADAETAGTSEATKAADSGGPATVPAAGNGRVNQGVAFTAQKEHHTHSNSDAGGVILMKHIQKSVPEGLSALQTWCSKRWVWLYATPFLCFKVRIRAIRTYCNWSDEDFMHAYRLRESGGGDILIKLCEDKRMLGVPAAGELLTEITESLHENHHPHGMSRNLCVFISFF